MIPDRLHLLPVEPSPQLIFKRTLQLNGSGIFYASSNPNHFPEHSAPHIKISIPLGRVSFQASWQTATGQRKQQHVRAGHICVLPANLPHEVVLKNKQEMVGINFEPVFIEQIADELTGKKVEIIAQWAAHDPLIQQLGIDLQREFHSYPRLLYVESVIQVLANHLVRHYCTNQIVVASSTSKLSPQKLQKTIDYIHARLEQDITLSELADVAQMSPYRFARAFKQATGIPPHQYLLAQRIERAKNLLTRKQLTIADISYQLGFASQSHFTATFRRFTKVTPTVYRNVGASF
jgi:AraC family transcriptional regulator